MNKIDEILKHLSGIKDATSRDPLPVTPEALEARARGMTDRAGYIHSRETLEALEAILQGYGVLLTGPAGTGKTSFFQALYRPIPKKIYTAQYLAGYLKPSEVAGWMEQFNDLDFIVDDLGSETIANDFGTRVEILPIILDYRSRLSGSRRTHVTTNLSAGEISDRYGDRTLDRILGLCKPFTFSGASHRIPKIIDVEK